RPLGCRLAVAGPDGAVIEAAPAAGEILVQGENVMRGHMGDPAATRQAFHPGGWLRPRDRGLLAADGTLHLIRRQAVAGASALAAAPALRYKRVQAGGEDAMGTVGGTSPARHFPVGALRRPAALLLAAALVLLLVLPGPAAAQNGEAADPAPDRPFTVDAAAAVLLDVHTGQILFAQNENERLAPASLTKIMTLLLALEDID